MISRRSLLTNSGVGAVALAAAVVTRELPAMAGNGNNGGGNHDRHRRRVRRRHNRNHGNGGLAGGFLPLSKDVIIEGNGDPSDNLEQKRDRRRNRRERRRDRRRRGN